MVKAIECASNRKATIISKPTTHLCNVIEEISQPLVNSKTLVIGDSLETDVVFANTAGFETLLVGSGTSQLKDVEEVIEKINAGDDSDELKQLLPGFYMKSLDEFYKKLLG